MNCIDGTTAHRWLIDTPEAGKKNLPAICKRCEQTRTYPVVIEDVIDRGFNTWSSDSAYEKPHMVVF